MRPAWNLYSNLYWASVLGGSVFPFERVKVTMSTELLDGTVIKVVGYSQDEAIRKLRKVLKRFQDEKGRTA